MLDSWPPAVRHLFIILAPIALGWVTSDVVPVLKDRNPLVATLVGAAIVAILAWLTPLTRQYGLWQADASAKPSHR